MTDNEFAGHVYNAEFQYCETCGRESEVCPCCGDGFPPHELFEAPEGVEPPAVYCTPCWETLFCEGGGPVPKHPVRPRQPKMNHAQEARLRLLCKRYGRTFDPNDYLVQPSTAAMMAGWVEGWIGGDDDTLYVGVSPNGESHS